MSDLLLTAILAASALGAALFVALTESGGLYRIPVITSGYRYHRDGLARHARVAEPTTALATVPDALTIARTA